MHLVERETELTALDSALAAVARRAGELVVIDGRAGLGKTALLSHVIDAARARGVRVLRARGSDLECDFPFGVVLQLFEPVIATAGARDELFAGPARLAAPLLDGRVEDGASGHGLPHGLYWLTSNLCRDGADDPTPIVVVIDDAQWTDVPSLRFLLHLAERLEDLPLLIVMACGPARNGASAELLERLRYHERATSLELRELSAGGVAALIRGSLDATADDGLCAACAQVSGGNPFLTRALAAELSRDRAAMPPARIAKLAPEAVLRSVIARLARLPSSCRRIVMAAAVLGDGAPLAHVAAVADPDVDDDGLDAVDAVDALARADVLQPEDPVRFTHPMIRSAVLADLTPLERLNLHQRAADVLHDAGARVEHVAAHLLSSRPVGAPWAADALRTAARRAQRQGAADSATDLFTRLLTEPLDESARTEASCERAAAAIAANRSDGLDLLRDAVAVAVTHPDGVRLLTSLGHALYSAGRRADAQPIFEQALALEPDRTAPAARELRALLVLAGAFAEPGDHRAAIAPIDRAQLTEADGMLLAVDAISAATAGAPAASIVDQVRRSRATLRGARQRSSVRDTTIASLAVALIYCDEIVECDRMLAEALDEARARGSHRAFVMATYLHAWPLYFAGKLVDLVAEVDSALATLPTGWRAHAASATSILAHAQLERGERAAAAASLDRAVAHGLDSGAHEQAILLTARGRLRLLDGDPKGALDDLRRCGELNGPADRIAALRWRHDAALAAAAADDVDLARGLADEELAIAESIGTARSIGAALRIKALVDGGADALATSARAVDVLARSPALLERARALVDHGAALRRARDTGGAREVLRAGLDLAQRFGAIELAVQAERELRAAGAKPRRKVMSGPDALTPTERRVVDLAASGLGNRQIAQRLFVSLKTIEGHLAHAYAKLGISSRRELVDALDEKSRA